MKVFSAILLFAMFAFAFAEDADDAAPDVVLSEGTPLLLNSSLVMASPDPMNVNIPFGLDVCLLGFKYGTPLCCAKCIVEKAYGGFCKGSKCWCIRLATKPRTAHTAADDVQS